MLSLKRGLIIIQLIWFFLMSGCAGVDPVVKIGLVGPFEGRHRDVGYDVIYSARLAVRQINADGGIGGYRIALVALDDSGDPEMAKETAASLVIDPAVVAVVGHWLSPTTEAADMVYINANLSFIQAGESPFAATDPSNLPGSFVAEYEAVTPFDETAGPYAAPAYDAFQLLWRAMQIAAQENGRIDRTSVSLALEGLEIDGITGLVYQ